MEFGVCPKVAEDVFVCPRLGLFFLGIVCHGFKLTKDVVWVAVSFGIQGVVKTYNATDNGTVGNKSMKGVPDL